MFYLKRKNKDHPVHCPSQEAGKDYDKNNLKEWRSLSLWRHLDPGALPDARNRGPGWQQWRLHPGQGKENRQELPLYREGVGAGEPWTREADVGQGPWKTMLLAGIHERVCTSGDARL